MGLRSSDVGMQTYKFLPCVYVLSVLVAKDRRGSLFWSSAEEILTFTVYTSQIHYLLNKMCMSMSGDWGVAEQHCVHMGLKEKDTLMNA